MSDKWNKYAPTAARSPLLGGRKPVGGISIDIHAHVGIAEAAEYVKPYLDWSTIPLAHFNTGDTRALNQRQDQDRASRMYGLDDRLKDMDLMGLDMQVVMPPPVQCYHTLPVDIATSAARIVNDGVAAYAARQPDRLIPFGTVPLQSETEVVAELERCVNELGFRGIEILTNIAGRELSDPAFKSFWQAAARLGVLVVIHPNGFTEGSRLSRLYSNNVIGNPLETTLALHCLIFDGVLERNPDLKILAVHGGGYLGAYAGRIDHAWGARSDCHNNLPKPPSTYLRQIFFDSVVFTEHQLKYLVDVYGEQNILMGTDYPYDMGEYAPVDHVQSVSAFTPEARRAIIGGNAARVLGLTDNILVQNLNLNEQMNPQSASQVELEVR